MIDQQGIAADWKPLIGEFFASRSGQSLDLFLNQRKAAGAVIYPPQPLRAFALTPREKVRVVLLGQDPYHGAGQAHGLAFSVPDGVRVPPSLRHIFQELAADVGCPIPASGNLERWACQGVLLLNAVLTVEEGEASAHAGCGWEQLTSAVMHALASDAAPKVFMLWGAHAQKNRPLIEELAERHCVLMANHPSPLSARRPPVPFFGSRHFSQANEFLQGHGRGTIDWCGA